MIGQVYKVHTDSYSVKCGEKLYKCGARGILKRRGNDIAVGDMVEVENEVISCVKQRKNRFIRPNVSNIDLILAVVSPEPKPDFYLLDKLYLNAVKEGVEFALVINKTDIDDSLYKSILAEYGNLGVEVLCVCAKTGYGISALKDKLISKLTVLAGQSAAGKTSIVNAMFGLELKTGAVSDKIARGKHTTTRSEIFEYENIKLIDSPGFAVIDAMVDLDELPYCYPEYASVSGECKFRGCAHINEPQCKVKELVENGILSKSRYQRYIEIYNEISKRRIIYEKN
ncbi:MAG: ribosome small subunit-dependent GTPase A [Clostridia bacterium]|nr:ribosome small subunit-dependent GTPase A [Clostridia bacterium]